MYIDMTASQEKPPVTTVNTLRLHPDGMEMLHNFCPDSVQRVDNPQRFCM